MPRRCSLGFRVARAFPVSNAGSAGLRVTSNVEKSRKLKLAAQGQLHFLVMELVEGDTLSQRLKNGNIAVEDALNIGKQIAEALEAAHEGGVIHRDLKPANVRITPVTVCRRAKTHPVRTVTQVLNVGAVIPGESCWTSSKKDDTSVIASLHAHSVRRPPPCGWLFVSINRIAWMARSCLPGVHKTPPKRRKSKLDALRKETNRAKTRRSCLLFRIRQQQSNTLHRCPSEHTEPPSSTSR